MVVSPALSAWIRRVSVSLTDRVFALPAFSVSSTVATEASEEVQVSVGSVESIGSMFTSTSTLSPSVSVSTPSLSPSAFAVSEVIALTSPPSAVVYVAPPSTVGATWM